jgi:hypothetical protein
VILPAPAAQSLYLDVGWGIVIAAILVAGLGRAGREGPRRRIGAVAASAGLAAVAVALPAPGSASFWLGMVMQSPSLMTVCLAGLFLLRALHGPDRPPAVPLLSTLPAVSLCLLAVPLYASTFALLPVDLYRLGFLPYAAVALASALVALWWRLDRSAAPAGTALCAAALLHASTRLPSGNGWDALLDPLLVLWAAIVALRAAWRCRRRGAPDARSRRD